jgi:hypothetical protein
MAKMERGGWQRGERDEGWERGREAGRKGGREWGRKEVREGILERGSDREG